MKDKTTSAWKKKKINIKSIPYINHLFKSNWLILNSSDQSLRTVS